MKKNGKRRNPGEFKRPVIITVIALLLLGALVLVTAGPRAATWIENAVGVIFTPIQNFAANVSNSIVGFFRHIFKTTDADKEVKRLQEELALYQQTQIELEEAKKENERLSKLLGYAESLGDYELVTAKVIGKSTDIWFRTFTINAGRNHGIDVNMPVICADGFVGCVTEVGATWCKVTALIDSGFKVPVMVERTRDNCMVRGVLDTAETKDYLELYYLPTDRSDLVPGDVIITSGLGGIYPKGIRIGTVSEVMSAESAIEGINGIVIPSVDFIHIEEVTVITGISDIPDEGAED